MESVKPVNEAPLRKARLLGIVYLATAIVLPFVILLIPESELPVSTGPIEVFFMADDTSDAHRDPAHLCDLPFL
jgi:hypothetical protein